MIALGFCTAACHTHLDSSLCFHSQISLHTYTHSKGLQLLQSWRRGVGFNENRTELTATKRINTCGFVTSCHLLQCLSGPNYCTQVTDCIWKTSRVKMYHVSMHSCEAKIPFPQALSGLEDSLLVTEERRAREKSVQLRAYWRWAMFLNSFSTSES